MYRTISLTLTPRLAALLAVIDEPDRHSEQTVRDARAEVAGYLAGMTARLR